MTEYKTILEKYFEITEMISKLDEEKEIIREDLLRKIKELGVDKLEVENGLISLVTTEKKLINKQFIESILTKEQMNQAYKVTNSQYIKITKKGEDI
jgi:phosphosulfolactate synthase (CoM biosynthesis protein A)